MSDLLLNVDLQEQSPSAEETASGNAIVTLFEVYLENSDLGGTAIDKLYFHDGTKAPVDSYGSLQMYSPILETSWGSTDSDNYALKTYTPFPFEFNGYERRTKGAIPRPTIRFSNINRDFTIYNSSHEDLLGAKVIRRRTFAKYLGENPPVEFPKEVYYIERLVLETSMVVEYELTTNFDVVGVTLPSRRIVASRCPWKYKDATRGGCDWPSDSTKDFTNVTGGSIGDQKVYVDVDDNYITPGTSSTSQYNSWNNGTALLNETLTNSDTTISYDNITRTDFPTKGTILIGSEKITYTGRTSTTFTGCTRGALSTTAATHSDNATISIYFTKDTFVEYYIPTSTSFYIDAGLSFIDTSSSMIEIGDVEGASINAGGAIAPTALINDGDGITNSDTTITFDTAIGTFPENGTVFIEDEQISYTATTSTTLTGCTRGVNGTTAATHNNNAVITAEAYVSVRGSTVSKWDFDEMALRVKKITDIGSTTQIYVVSPDASNTGVYTGNGIGGYMSTAKNVLFKCIKGHTANVAVRPGSTLGKDYWEYGDVCGKRLTSCKKRFGYIANSGTIEALTVAVINGTVVSGVGYTSAPTITIADPPSGTTATATCTISGGSIDNVEIINPGSGYTSSPAVTLSTSGSSTAARLRATVRGEYIDSPLPFGGFPGAVTYS